MRQVDEPLSTIPEQGPGPEQGPHHDAGNQDPVQQEIPLDPVCSSPRAMDEAWRILVLQGKHVELEVPSPSFLYFDFVWLFVRHFVMFGCVLGFD